jgi:demethylmenaquinone methyltransferase / 2-methoxy-6-polyprenyl-1,4-benzoquinol methylase
MAGSGECWNYLRRRLRPNGKIVSVDFSPVMCGRQKCRLARLNDVDVSVRQENALSTTLADNSVDFIVSAFGLKTFNGPLLDRLALEMFRILRPGGSCSLLEISLPASPFLCFPYLFYIKSVIPLIGRIFLKDIECYKMLGIYTEAFGSCAEIVEHFQNAGFQVGIKKHFFGCATSLIAKKSGTEISKTNNTSPSKKSPART